MTKKLIASTTPAPAAPASVSNPLDDNAQVLAQRDALRHWMRAQRQAAVPRLTQLKLSEALGFSYAVVTAWEGGIRFIQESQLRAWGQQLGIDGAVLDAQIAAAGAAVQPDEKSGLVTGSRMDAAVSERMKWLRAELRLSLREFADATGITAGHLQRIESNASNLSVAQLRNVHRRLRVNYEWLIDGVGQYNQGTLLDEVTRLRRENELLENLRQVRLHPR